ncbi:ABC transporter permease [Parendozoicomonas haliclonae]|uniref:sn-glycerol-3-phosphate transport system permease protein UgpA n=1 Tax=Parendozoicomonas haliclonae TaxID=1960125 RepID=A0A1X7AGW5_9GAMM|nr:ABC transporter permease subunit [Parendozoicomonas haliclonae]SMA39653.1 sn-glycerol-3-phosphate transport system permease protein UgpA [Parendozoicomonas haliclonae]
MNQSRTLTLLMVVPALLMVVGLFVVPLLASMESAFATGEGYGFAHFAKAIELYGRDILYTLGIVSLSAVLIALLSIAIGGTLTLSGNRRLVAVLAAVYRWPLFIPFIVAAQCMRTFLAKNGLMNNALMSADVITPLEAVSFLDWSGIVFAFVWKQTAFATLMIAGAMAAMERSQIQAAANLGAGKARILFQIILPQVSGTVGVALILSIVTMLSVLSVPLMIGTGTPTMLTADMAFRISSYGDYGVANALGFISWLMTAGLAWYYLRFSMRNQQQSLKGGAA